MKVIKCFGGLKWTQAFSSQRTESLRITEQTSNVTSANVNLKLHQYISSFFLKKKFKNVYPCLAFKKLFLSKHLIFLLIALQKAME